MLPSLTVAALPVSVLFAITCGRIPQCLTSVPEPTMQAA